MDLDLALTFDEPEAFSDLDLALDLDAGEAFLALDSPLDLDFAFAFDVPDLFRVGQSLFEQAS